MNECRGAAGGKCVFITSAKTNKYIYINHLHAVPESSITSRFQKKTTLRLKKPPPPSPFLLQWWFMLEEEKHARQGGSFCKYLHAFGAMLAAKVHQASRFIPLALAQAQRREKCVSIYHANACNGNLSHIICIRATHSSCQKDKGNSSAIQVL